jgi:hypothetical protein
VGSYLTIASSVGQTALQALGTVISANNGGEIAWTRGEVALNTYHDPESGEDFNARVTIGDDSYLIIQGPGGITTSNSVITNLRSPPLQFLVQNAIVTERQRSDTSTFNVFVPVQFSGASTRILEGTLVFHAGGQISSSTFGIGNTPVVGERPRSGVYLVSPRAPSGRDVPYTIAQTTFDGPGFVNLAGTGNIGADVYFSRLVLSGTLTGGGAAWISDLEWRGGQVASGAPECNQPASVDFRTDGGRASPVVALITRSMLGTGNSFTSWPTWWPSGTWVRGHLLASVLGGIAQLAPGRAGINERNLVPLYQRANREMENCELKVRDAVQLAGCVLYDVRVSYPNTTTRIPSRINISAEDNLGCFSLRVTILNVANPGVITPCRSTR